MLPSKTSTFSGAQVSDVKAKQFRNQATGIGQSRGMSEATGAVRSLRVIDCAPKSQLVVADRSYPRPTPLMNPDGTMLDAVTGLPWKQVPALGGPN